MVKYLKVPKMVSMNRLVEPIVYFQFTTSRYVNPCTVVWCQCSLCNDDDSSCDEKFVQVWICENLLLAIIVYCSFGPFVLIWLLFVHLPVCMHHLSSLEAAGTMPLMRIIVNYMCYWSTVVKYLKALKMVCMNRFVELNCIFPVHNE